jgi:hypothetical protein
MNRTEILETAVSHITVDRAATHGDAEDSFASIAQVWQWWLDKRPAHSDLNAFDVAMMMSLLKHARAAGNPRHDDNFVDGAGYLAIAGELMDPRSPRPPQESRPSTSPASDEA